MLNMLEKVTKNPDCPFKASRSCLRVPAIVIGSMIADPAAVRPADLVRWRYGPPAPDRLWWPI
jgi:MinD-like ATPase involved in chromosome partitioning or flagellar assembly